MFKCFLSIHVGTTFSLSGIRGLFFMNIAEVFRLIITYYLIYLTLHWPFLNNVRQCSLSIKSLYTAVIQDKQVYWTFCGLVAQWLRFWTVHQETMGSNPAETVFFFYLSTHSTNVKYCCFSNCVVINATIFSLDCNETLDFCFDMLNFC